MFYSVVRPRIQPGQSIASGGSLETAISRVGNEGKRSAELRQGRPGGPIVDHRSDRAPSDRRDPTIFPPRTSRIRKGGGKVAQHRYVNVVHRAFNGVVYGAPPIYIPRVRNYPRRAREAPCYSLIDVGHGPTV